MHNITENSSSPASPAENQSADLSYAQKFQQMDKEAAAVIIAALLITAFFWGSIYLFKDSPAEFLALPLWFVVSCLGGYLLSIAAVWVLVRRFMRNFSLD